MTRTRSTSTLPLERWKRLEETLQVGRYSGTGPDRLLVKTPEGAVSLLTAPHSVTHHRDGVRKGADMGTGGLTWTLGQETRSAVLIASGEQRDDGNWDEGLFKTRLRRLLEDETISEVVDLHGMSSEHQTDICLGRGSKDPGSSDLLERLETNLTAAGFHVTVNSPFTAERPGTVTRTAQQLGRAGVQVEIAPHLRSPSTNPAEALSLLTALKYSLNGQPIPVQRQGEEGAVPALR